MRPYELMIIVSGALDENTAHAWIKQVTKSVTSVGGSVHGTPDWWGRRRLAYPIRQYFEGSYVLATLRMPPAGAVALARLYRARLPAPEDILDPGYAGERSRDGRGERRDGVPVRSADTESRRKKPGFRHSMAEGSVWFRAKVIMLILAGINVWIFHSGIYTRVAGWELSSPTPKAASASRCAVLYALGSSLAERTTRIPRPPPPATALMMTG